MQRHEIGSPETYWRLWRLEEKVDQHRETLKDHEDRIETIEEAKPLSLLSPQLLKEALMIAAIGMAIGSMVVTGDPAGVALIMQKLLGGKV